MKRLQKIKPILITTLLLATSFLLSRAETAYKLHDLRPLNNTAFIGVDDQFVALLKPVKDLHEYDKKSLKEVIGILEVYYKNEVSKDVKVNVNFANLIRIGELEDNFFKDGIFVYYCSSALSFDADKKKGKIVYNTVLVTLDGKVIPRFTQTPTKASKKKIVEQGGAPNPLPGE